MYTKNKQVYLKLTIQLSGTPLGLNLRVIDKIIKIINEKYRMKNYKPKISNKSSLNQEFNSQATKRRSSKCLDNVGYL